MKEESLKGIKQKENIPLNVKQTNRIWLSKWYKVRQI